MFKLRITAKSQARNLNYYLFKNIYAQTSIIVDYKKRFRTFLQQTFHSI